MRYYLIKNANNLTQGRGFSREEAIEEVCFLNELIGDGPTTKTEVEKLLGKGVLHVLELDVPANGYNYANDK